MHLEKDPAGGALPVLVVDNKEMVGMDFDNLYKTLVGQDTKETGKTLEDFDPQAVFDSSWQDMDARTRHLDKEGVDAQIIYPSLGLLWEGTVTDPQLADAHCRAYNAWAAEVCAGHRERLHPVAHISLRDPDLAVRELERVAKLDYRAAFVGAIPHGGTQLRASGLRSRVGCCPGSRHQYLHSPGCPRTHPRCRLASRPAPRSHVHRRVHLSGSAHGADDDGVRRRFRAFPKVARGDD